MRNKKLILTSRIIKLPVMIYYMLIFIIIVLLNDFYNIYIFIFFWQFNFLIIIKNYKKKKYINKN